jgi:hypothetical protein
MAYGPRIYETNYKRVFLFHDAVIVHRVHEWGILMRDSK